MGVLNPDTLIGSMDVLTVRPNTYLLLSFSMKLLKQIPVNYILEQIKLFFPFNI